MGALDAFLDEALVQYYRRALFHVDANDGNDANDANRRETRRTGRDSPRPDDGSGRTYPRDPSSSKGPEDPSRSDGASTRQEAPSSGSRNGGSTNSRLSGGSASLDESSSSSGLHFSLASTSASGVGLGGSAGTVPLSSTDGNGPQSTPQRPAYEVAMLLNTARPRRDLEEILAKILQAGLELDVAGPDQTMQKDRAIVFLHIPDDKCVAALCPGRPAARPSWRRPNPARRRWHGTWADWSKRPRTPWPTTSSRLPVASGLGFLAAPSPRRAHPTARQGPPPLCALRRVSARPTSTTWTRRPSPAGARRPSAFASFTTSS